MSRAFPRLTEGSPQGFSLHRAFPKCIRKGSAQVYSQGLHKMYQGLPYSIPPFRVFPQAIHKGISQVSSQGHSQDVPRAFLQAFHFLGHSPRSIARAVPKIQVEGIPKTYQVSQGIPLLRVPLRNRMGSPHVSSQGHSQDVPRVHPKAFHISRFNVIRMGSPHVPSQGHSQDVPGAFPRYSTPQGFPLGSHGQSPCSKSRAFPRRTKGSPQGIPHPEVSLEVIRMGSPHVPSQGLTPKNSPS